MDCDFTSLVFLCIEKKHSNFIYVVALFVLKVLEIINICILDICMYVCMYTKKLLSVIYNYNLSYLKFCKLVQNSNFMIDNNKCLSCVCVLIMYSLTCMISLMYIVQFPWFPLVWFSKKYALVAVLCLLVYFIFPSAYLVLILP